jgi:hypothetical protein
MKFSARVSTAARQTPFSSRTDTSRPTTSETFCRAVSRSPASRASTTGFRCTVKSRRARQEKRHKREKKGQGRKILFRIRESSRNTRGLQAEAKRPERRRRNGWQGPLFAAIFLPGQFRPHEPDGVEPVFRITQRHIQQKPRPQDNNAFDHQVSL